MRWPQFLLTLLNLAFAIYILMLNLLASDSVKPITFLWSLIYLTLALSIAHLYMLYMSNKIDDWYDVESMKSIKNLSIFTLIVCAIALILQLGLEYYHTKTIKLNYGMEIFKTPFIPLGAAIICSVILFTSSIKFKKYVILCKSIEVQTTQMKNYRTAD